MPSIVYRGVGPRIAYERRIARLTQAELARSAGVALGTCGRSSAASAASPTPYWKLSPAPWTPTRRGCCRTTSVRTIACTRRCRICPRSSRCTRPRRMARAVRCRTWLGRLPTASLSTSRRCSAGISRCFAARPRGSRPSVARQPRLAPPDSPDRRNRATGGAGPRRQRLQRPCAGSAARP